MHKLTQVLLGEGDTHRCVNSVFPDSRACSLESVPELPPPAQAHSSGPAVAPGSPPRPPIRDAGHEGGRCRLGPRSRTRAAARSPRPPQSWVRTPPAPRPGLPASAWEPAPAGPARRGCGSGSTALAPQTPALRVAGARGLEGRGSQPVDSPTSQAFLLSRSVWNPRSPPHSLHTFYQGSGQGPARAWVAEEGPSGRGRAVGAGREEGAGARPEAQGGRGGRGWAGASLPRASPGRPRWGGEFKRGSVAAPVGTGGRVGGRAAGPAEPRRRGWLEGACSFALLPRPGLLRGPYHAGACRVVKE